MWYKQGRPNAKRTTDSDDPEDLGIFTNAVRRLCIELKQKSPGKPIVFITPYRMRGIGNYEGGLDARTSDSRRTDLRNYVSRTLEDYVFELRRFCREQELPAPDPYRGPGADIAHSDADEARYTLDGCRPYAKGHRLIADTLYAFCKENGPL